MGSFIAPKAFTLSVQGSGIFCGFHAFSSPFQPTPGVADLVFVQLNTITSSKITNMQYANGVEKTLPELNPRVAFSVRMDARYGYAALYIFAQCSCLWESTAGFMRLHVHAAGSAGRLVSNLLSHPHPAVLSPPSVPTYFRLRKS